MLPQTVNTICSSSPLAPLAAATVAAASAPPFRLTIHTGMRFWVTEAREIDMHVAACVFGGGNCGRYMKNKRIRTGCGERQAGEKNVARVLGLGWMGYRGWRSGRLASGQSTRMAECKGAVPQQPTSARWVGGVRH